MEKRRVLFVDDDQMVLDGLRRMMRPLRKALDMKFALGGQEALKLMENEEFDVIVSDMRMPGMDGASLLEEVKKRYPGTMRVVLTGQASEDATMKVVKAAHQFLDKPCEPERLKEVLQRALFIKRLMTHPALERLVAGLESLPSLPEIYTEIQRLLEDPESSVDDVAELVAKDVAMSAKILQLVNSAFFGHFQKVETPQKAVHLLGLETLKALVLSLHVFSQFSDHERLPFSIEALWKHSLSVAALAKVLALKENLSEMEVDNAFLGGLLHDIGKLVLAANMPDEYRQAMEHADKEGMELFQAEVDFFKAGHPEVGAYLMGLWGLPGPVVEAIAYHHRPDRYPSQRFDSFSAVYAANVLDYEDKSDFSMAGSIPQFDVEYLRRIGCDRKVEIWRDLIRKEKESWNG